MTPLRALAVLVGLAAGSGLLHGQSCLHPRSDQRSAWALGIASSRYSYAEHRSLYAERSGAVLSVRGRIGQTYSAQLDEFVYEGAGILGARLRRGALQACAFAGGFAWRGPTRPVLGWDTMSSGGVGGGAEVSYAVPISSRITLSPYVTASWDVVRARRERRIPGLPSDSAARYMMRTTEIGAAVAIDRQLSLRIALQRPSGMPDETQLGPFGRKNGERALVLGATYAFD